jgi:hypothetical protein
MERGFRAGRRRAVAFAALLSGGCVFLSGAGALIGAGLPDAAAASTPDLVSGSSYLVAPANLIGGDYYESYPGTADFGLTIDGAFALAATGDDKAALRKIVTFIDHDGADPSGDTVNDWTGIGTSYASGGAIGKEALLAEVTGLSPRSFGGHNLIAALDASVCVRPSAGGNTSCPGTGSYLNDTSVFDQALGVIAQFRAGQASQAAAPVTYLESLQSANGSFPSLIPPSGGPDVDSTAMAVMALALAPGPRAASDVAAGISWIASRQEGNGGFPGSGAESINSTGLAIQALTLRAGAYRSGIAAAEAFLAGQQNGNGGFNADAGQPGSNVRASTQAVGGAVGTSFGTLSIDLNSPASPTDPASPANPASPGSSPTHQAGTTGRQHARPAGSGRPHPSPSAVRSHDAAAPAPALAQTRSLKTRAASGDWLTLAIAIIVAVAVVAAVAASIARQRMRRRRLRRLGEPTPRAADVVDPAAQTAALADSGASDQVSS